jgi:hypothetical protein
MTELSTNDLQRSSAARGGGGHRGVAKGGLHHVDGRTALEGWPPRVPMLCSNVNQVARESDVGSATPQVIAVDVDAHNAQTLVTAPGELDVPSSCARARL